MRSLLEMPDWCGECHDTLPAVHYPFDARYERYWVTAFYECQYGHQWACGWNEDESYVHYNSESSADRLHEHKRHERSRSRAIPQDVKVAVAVRDDGQCRQCGSSEQIEYDHIFPFSKGGTSEVDNIQLLCKGCNRKKKDKISTR